MNNTILITTTSFPSYLKKFSNKKRGGADFLRNDTDALLNAGYRIIVLMPMKEGLDSYENHENLIIYRFKSPFLRKTDLYYHRPLHQNRNLLQYFALAFMFIQFKTEVSRLLKQYSPSVIWANWLQVGYFTQLGNKNNIPLLCTIRGSDVRNFPAKLTYYFSKKIPCILNPYAVDEELKGWIKDFSLKEIEVPAIYRKKKICRKISNLKNIVIIGRMNGENDMIKIKGLGINFFYIIKELLRERSDFKITVIGDGKELPSYRQIMEGEDRVFFTGWVSDVGAELSDAYVVIGGAGINGVIIDTVPYQIPQLISVHNNSSLWKNKHNCIKYDPLDQKKFKKSIQFALDNPSLINEYGKTASNDIMQYMSPMEEAGEILGETMMAYARDYNRYIKA